MSPIKIDPEIMGGKPCFAGTRVPVKILFEVLEVGRDLDSFLHSYPTVERWQALAVLAQARDVLLDNLQPSKVA